ncbi:hypothetical protein ACFE04_000179 [Oxalis oulophora]
MKRRNPKRSAVKPPGINSLESNRIISREVTNDDPKTSEWAYFKKLKTESTNTILHHHQRPTTNTSCSQDFRPSMLAKSVSPINVYKSPFLSYGNPSTFAEKNHKGPSTTSEDMCNAYKSMEECSTTMRNEGNQDKHEDIFSQKRQKLLLWVAKTSSHLFDKCDTERSNLVPKLLSRLFPGNSEDTDLWTSKLGQVERNTRHLDSHLKKTQQMSTRNASVVESSRYLDCDLMWMDRDRSRDIVISNIGPAAYHDLRTQESYLNLPAFQLRERATISGIERNNDSGFSFTKYDFPLIEFCRELDDYHDPVDNGRLLTLESAFRADCTNEVSGSSYSSAMCSYTPDFISFTPTHLATTRRHDYDIGRYICKDMAIDWNLPGYDIAHQAIGISNYQHERDDDHHYPIDNGRLLTLGNEYKDDCRNEFSYTPFISFPASHLASTRRQDYDIGRHVFEDIATDGYDIPHQAIDISNYNDISSSHFYLPQGQEKPCWPLLLEKPYWDGSEDDRYNDEDDIIDEFRGKPVGASVIPRFLEL